MQPGPDVVRRVRRALALVARDQHPAGHHTGDTGQSDQLPDTSHRQSVPKLRVVNANTVSLERALDETRTGDIWLFRGGSGPDRAIQTMSNAPVNHVGMTVAIDDMPPLIWHAELGDKLLDMWTGDQSPRRSAQRSAPGRRAVDGHLRAAVLAAPADAVRHPRAGGQACCRSSPGWTARRSPARPA